MKLFLKRLKRVGSELLVYMSCIGIAGLIVWGLISLPTIVLKVIAFTIWAIILLGLLLFVVAKVWKFIKWLFIEPFRKVK